MEKYLWNKQVEGFTNTGPVKGYNIIKCVFCKWPYLEIQPVIGSNTVWMSFIPDLDRGHKTCLRQVNRGTLSTPWYLHWACLPNSYFVFFMEFVRLIFAFWYLFLVILILFKQKRLLLKICIIVHEIPVW